MKKRLISTLLVLCMVLGMLPETAFATESETLTEPRVTGLTVSCDGETTIDLLGDQPTISMPAGSKLVFTVTFDSPELLKQVFVTSTKDDETKYLEAIPQEGKYVADGYFDPDDTNYIPGTISVTYSKKAVTVSESGDVGGTNLNTLKAQLSSQGVSCRNETTAADGTITAEIALGDLLGATTDVYFDAAISEFNAGAGIDQGELNKWLGVYENLSELSSYDLEGADGKQYTLYLSDKDLGDTDTYLVMVKDATSNKYTKMIISKAANSLGLGDISDAMSAANLASGMLLKYNAISKETSALREEIETHPTMTQQEKAEANARITALDRDKKLFVMGMTVVPFLVNPVGAPLMISALLAGYSSIADYFWEHRVGMIKGNEPINSQFAVSGTCGEHLTWSLNGGGTLTVSGYGPMTEFPSSPSIPWFPYTYSGHIKKVVINSGATSIGRAAFSDCRQLKNVSIPNTVESIGEYAFRGCNQLEKIVLPSSVTSMGSHIFDKCSNLNSVGPIGGNYDIQFGWIEEIPANAFSPSSITSAVIPEGICKVGDEAFFLTDIDYIQLPKSLISIGNRAFSSTKLTQISIPENVTNIGSNAFSSCSNLTMITLPLNLTSIGRVAFYDTGYFNNDSNWDSDVLYIGNYLIKGKKSVSGDYHVKEGTKCIADDAFNYGTIYFNNLTSIIMPSSITHIGRNAFDSCLSSHGFRGVYFKGNAPTVYDGISSERSFHSRTKLFYIEGKEGWTIGSDSCWNGYPAEMWKDNMCQHTYDSVITPSTCTERGYTTYTCNKCGNSYQDNYVDALGHDYGEWITVEESTDTAPGQKERVCSRCDNKETEVIPATGSSTECEHSYESSVTAPTCAEQGYTAYTCSKCGNSYMDDYVDALGHDYGEWVTVEEPTFTTPGQKERTCSRCDYKETEVIPATGSSTECEHSYESSVTAPTCTEQGYTTYTCSKCGNSYTDNYINALGHSYGEWRIVISTTATTDGLLERFCVRCSDRQTQTIPATGESTYPSAPNYGSGSNSNVRHYSVSTPTRPMGGDVKLSSTNASVGSQVTVTAIPDSGYELASLTVTDSKGNELKLTDKGNGKYTFVTPASAVTVNAVFEKIAPPPVETPVENTTVDETYLFPFGDIMKTDWFSDAVWYVFSNDLMSGTAPYTFNPQGKMNRAMVWTVLGRMADADVDDSDSAWYSKAQKWAITNNVSDGTNPTNSISRQELMTMLWRYMGNPAATADLSKFSDNGSVAGWADAAMQWAVSTGLIVGDNGRLNPTGDARRCEVAMIFTRFCKSIAE